MNRGVSITMDLLLILLVLVVITRGLGKSWLETLFTYHKADLHLNPLEGFKLEPPRVNIQLPGGVSVGGGGGGGGTGQASPASSPANGRTA